MGDTATRIEIPADLSPAGAGETRAAILAALEAAGTAAEVELGEGPARPTASQLLVATAKTARALAADLTFGPRARAALDALEF